MKTIHVRKNVSWCDLPEKLTDFIDFFEEALKEVPEQYRECAKIDWYVSAPYDSAIAELSVIYKRPYSIAEREEMRVEREKAAAIREREQRKLYEELRRKFEG